MSVETSSTLEQRLISRLEQLVADWLTVRDMSVYAPAVRDVLAIVGGEVSEPDCHADAAAREDALKQAAAAMEFALNELGETDVNGQMHDHWCAHCDQFVDSSRAVRDKLRAAIDAARRAGEG